MSTQTPSPTEKLARTRARIVAALSTSKNSNRNEAKSDSGLLSSILAMYLAQHPLHATGSAASHMLEMVVAPWVREHPVQALVGAALAGGLLIWIRPWKLLRPAAPMAWFLLQLTKKLVKSGQENSTPVPK